MTLAKSETLSQGLLHLPGANHKAKALVKRLLEEDSEKHHCFWGKPGFHNHLSHHLLAAYDFGAPVTLLQAIYDVEAKVLSPINLVDRKENIVAPPEITITKANWTEYVGLEKHYVSYLEFFKSEVSRLGSAECLEEYVFSPKANGNETFMLLRLAGGAVHPLIQTGYGIEFNEPLLVASGLAMAAVHKPLAAAIYEDGPPQPIVNGVNHAINFNADEQQTRRQPSHGPSLLAIVKMMYESDILVPVMPYQPEQFISARLKEALTNGRPEEIRRLSSLWAINPDLGDPEFDARIEEIIWLCTLLTVSTGRHGRKPRLDFFLMHLLTSSLLLPSYVKAIINPHDKVRLLRVFISEILMLMLLRGRPRIDVSLVMSFNDYPTPPSGEKAPTPDSSCLADPRKPEDTNPWPAIIASVVHAPDAHTLKAVRTLYYAAQKYGNVPEGGAIGAFNDGGQETFTGTSKMDGSIFIRAAGVVMDTLGWVTHGQKEGQWDRSALGWDAAWDGPD